MLTRVQNFVKGKRKLNEVFSFILSYCYIHYVHYDYYGIFHSCLG